MGSYTLTWTAGTAIGAGEQLPAAVGGDGALTYTLTPEADIPDGVTFDAATRTFSGTPAASGTASLTLTATDSDAANPDSATLWVPVRVRPPVPASFRAAPGDGQASLRWDDPGDPGIAKYQIRQWTGGGTEPASWTDIAGSGADTTSHTVSGLTNGTEYRFKVRAFADMDAVSLASAEAIATPMEGLANCGDGPLQGRTQGVVDVIVAAVDGVDDCAAVTAAHLAAITELSFYFDRLGSLRSGDFAGLTALRDLNLWGNNLAALPEDLFAGLSALRDLNLWDNDLTTLPEDLFDGLSALSELSLQDNALTALPGDLFAGLSALTRLSLEENEGLTSLPADLFDGLTALERLRLDTTGLTGVPADLFDGLSSLQSLNLGQNPLLTSLPAGLFDGLSGLQSLSLEENALTGLPAGLFDGMTMLEDLDLRDNDLTALPAGVFDDLSGVYYLYLEDNDLTALPAGLFDGMTTLNEVYLSGNSLTGVPAGLFDGRSNLGYVNLSDNALTCLPGGLFDGLSELRTLYLDGNSLGNVAPAYFAGQGLTELYRLELGTAGASSTALASYQTALPGLTNLKLTAGAEPSYPVCEDATLRALTLTHGSPPTEVALDPAFAAATEGYAARVPPEVAEVTLTATATTETADSSVAEAEVAADPGTGTFAATGGAHTATATLGTGDNHLRVRVTAIDGATRKTYTLTVRRPAAPGNPTALTLSTAAAAFDEDTTPEVTVTATLDDAAPAGGVTVTLAEAGTPGSAALGSDWTLPADPAFTIEEGDTSGAAAIAILPDAVDEDDETIVLTATGLVTATGLNLTAPPDHTITIIDDDTAGIAVTAAPNLTTHETGTTATFTVGLDSEPTADVAIEVASRDESEGLVSTGGGAPAASLELRFTPDDYAAKTVTVTGQDDAMEDGAQTYTIALAPDSDSADPVYAAIDPDDVRVTNIDDDTAPTKPSNFAAATGDGQVTLSWSDPGDAGIAKYQLRQWASADSEPAAWTDIAGSTAATTSHTVAGLTNGTAYSFRIRAVGVGGDGAASDAATATPSYVPAKPSNFTATAGNGEATLSWDDPGDAGIAKYQLRQWASADGEPAAWTDIAGSTAATTSHTVAGLTNGTAYSFRIRAVAAGGGSAASDAVTATPGYVPAAPSNFAATAGNGEATLGWDDPGDAGIVKYQLRQWASAGSEPAAWTDIAGSTAATTTHTVAGLTNGTAYSFRIRAVGAGGGSAASDAATATPGYVPAEPSNFTATAGNGEATLGWDDPGDAGIAKYQLRQWASAGSEPAAWTDIAGSTAATTSHTVTGLTNGTAYSFRIRAVAAGGGSAASDTATATPIGVEGGDPDTTPTVTTNADGTTTIAAEVAGFPVRLTLPSGHSVGRVAFDPDAPAPAVASPRGVTFGADPAWVNIELDTDIPDGASAVVCLSEPAGLKKPAVWHFDESTMEWTALDDPESTPTPPGFVCGATEAFSPFVVGGAASSNATLSAIDLTDAAGNDIALNETFDPAKTDYTAGAASRVDEVAVKATPAHEAASYIVTVDGAAIDAAGLVPLAVGETAIAVAVTAEDRSTTQTYTVTVTRDPAVNLAERGQAMKRTLAAFGRTVAESMAATVEERAAASRQAPEGSVQGTIAGQAVALHSLGDDLGRFFEGLAEEDGSLRSLEADEVLSGTSFQLSPLGSEGAWTLWGRGAASRFEGRPERGFDMSGEVLSGHLGFDTRLREDLLAGVAASRSEGAMSYRFAGGTEGEMDTVLTGVHPYAHWSPRAGLGLWATLGYGAGEATLDDGVEGPATTDLAMRMAAAGARKELAPAHGVDWALKADAFLVRIDTEGLDDLLPAVSAESHRLRVAAEGSASAAFDGGSRLRGTVELGARLDGGDADEGAGVETGGRVAWADPALGLDVEAHGRLLVAHGAEGFDEWGASLSARFDPGAPGVGFHASLAPALGEMSGGADALWESAGAVAAEDEDGGAPAGRDAAMRLEAEAGYGLGLAGEDVLLTPFGGLNLSDRDRRERLGARLGITASRGLDMAFELYGERELRDDATGGSALVFDSVARRGFAAGRGALDFSGGLRTGDEADYRIGLKLRLRF